MAKVCRWAIVIFAVLYAFALAILLIGVFGWFGQEKDPLSAVYLLPLGLPWVFWVDALPPAVLAPAAALTPLLNLIILITLCRLLRSRSR